jgi:glucokinase-like ROK family protein
MSKVRHKNEIRRNLILRALLDNGQLSLTDLMKITGVTIPVVSGIISSLVKEGLIIEVKDKDNTQAGRPPYLVKLNGKAGFILGVDIGRLFTNFIVMDLEHNILIDVRRKSIPLSNDISLIGQLEKEIKGVISEGKISWNKLLGIGISIPGMVKGRIGASETYFNFGNKSAKEMLEEKFKKPVHIEHDLQAMALGELWFGGAKNEKNALCINFGWGLGVGIILDGKVYYGEDGYAGEFGHIQIIPDGELCYCGKKGCLETVSSSRAITKIAQQRIEKGATTRILNEVSKIEDIDSKTIFQAANQGDQFSIEIIEEAGGFLGSGIAILINLFNPSLIILGGGVSNAAPYLIDIIKSNAMKHSLVQLNKNVRFVTSKLGYKAGALGVAMYMARDLFDVDHLNPIAYV